MQLYLLRSFVNILMAFSIAVLPVYGFCSVNEATIERIRDTFLLKVTHLITFTDTSSRSETSAILIDKAGDCFMYSMEEYTITHHCSEEDEGYANTLLSDFENCYDSEKQYNQEIIAKAQIATAGLGVGFGGMALYELISLKRKAVHTGKPLYIPNLVRVNMGLTGLMLLILGVTTAIFTPDELSVSAKSACEQKHGGHLHILPVSARFYNPLI